MRLTRYTGHLLKKAMTHPDRLTKYIKPRLAYRFCSLIDGYAPLPNIINLAISSRCNLHCNMCSIGQKNEESAYYYKIAKSDELEARYWKGLFDELSTYKPAVYFAAAEPLLYKDIVDVLAYAREKGLRCFLITNGTLLSRFASEIIKVGVEEVLVSIDGPPEIHNLQRGSPTAFQRSYEGIERLLILRGKHKHPRISLQCVISNYNFSYLTDMIEFFEKLPIDNYIFAHLNFMTPIMVREHRLLYPDYPITRYGDAGIDTENINISILRDQIEAVQKKFKRLPITFYPNLKSHHLYTYYREHKKVLGTATCISPWMNCLILPNGDVFHPGCFSGDAGNIRDESLTTIWNNSQKRNFRKAFRKRRVSPACLRCCGFFINDRYIFRPGRSLKVIAYNSQ